MVVALGVEGEDSEVVVVAVEGLEVVEEEEADSVLQEEGLMVDMVVREEAMVVVVVVVRQDTEEQGREMIEITQQVQAEGVEEEVTVAEEVGDTMMLLLPNVVDIETNVTG